MTQTERSGIKKREKIIFAGDQFSGVNGKNLFMNIVHYIER